MGVMIRDMNEVIEYLEEALDSFIIDPADTDYQLGYLAALKELYENIQI